MKGFWLRYQYPNIPSYKRRMENATQENKSFIKNHCLVSLKGILLLKSYEELSDKHAKQFRVGENLKESLLYTQSLPPLPTVHPVLIRELDLSQFKFFIALGWELHPKERS